MVVHEHGDPAAEPVVLLHGFPGGAADWDGVAARLAATRRVLVPDLLGFGDGPRPARFEELWADAQAEALLEALDERGLTRAALVGHDFGGPVALAALRRAPERATHLVLASTNVFADTPVPLPLSLVRLPLVGDAAARALFSRPSLALLGRRASLGPRPHRNDAGEARTIRTIFSRVLRDLPQLYGPLEETARASRLPALVLWGDRDPFFPLEQGHRTAELLGAELVVLERTGHFVPLERPEEVATAVERLLASGSLPV
jgi:pimeloyl-ACP methyl ester carboxylesterase